MRPSGTTPVASAMTNPARPNENDPRCATWKSPTTPSTAEYMHIGATHARLASSSERKRMGVNRWLIEMAPLEVAVH
jgi:hypothetical protein